MATKRKPKPKKLKFELTKSAITGIGVVVFCLFLWMFLLGVWAGQSFLLPFDKSAGLVAGKNGDTLGPLVIKADKKVVKKTDKKK